MCSGETVGGWRLLRLIPVFAVRGMHNQKLITMLRKHRSITPVLRPREEFPDISPPMFTKCHMPWVTASPVRVLGAAPAERARSTLMNDFNKKQLGRTFK